MGPSPGLPAVKIVFAIALALLSGCESKRPVDPSKEATGGAGSTAGKFPLTVAAANEDFVDAEPFRDVWESHYLQGTKIGHARTSYTRAKLDGEPVVKIERQSRLSVLRLGQQVEMVMREVSWETESGEVRRFENTVVLGDTPQITRGVVKENQAMISLLASDKSSTQTLAWPADTRGPLGVPDDLMKRPMKPGETRVISTFLPVYNRIAEVTMNARQRESTAVGPAKRELLRIDAVAEIDGGQKLHSIVWIDEQGNAVKSEFPELGQSAVQTTAAGAVAKDDSGLPAVDLGRSTMVKLAAPFSDAHQKTLARYRATLRGGDAIASLPSCESQTVKKLDGAAESGAAEIMVVALRPETPLPSGYVPKPSTAGDLAANSLVQSDDPKILAMARGVAGDEPDLWKKATSLEAYVRSKVRTTEFSPAFGTAADTAKSLTGDCTEFSVLLCALLRASGIPARGAIGLVYVDRDQAFVYHMWTEAYIDNRWIGLDATRGVGGLSAAYLKIADMSFDGADPYSGLMAIFGIVGRLQVEVLEAR